MPEGSQLCQCGVLPLAHPMGGWPGLRAGSCPREIACTSHSSPACVRILPATNPRAPVTSSFRLVFIQFRLSQILLAGGARVMARLAGSRDLGRVVLRAEGDLNRGRA